MHPGPNGSISPRGTAGFQRVLERVMFASLASRAINNIRSPFAHRIHFLHIPKCGGTWLRHAMRAPYLRLDVRRDQRLVHLNAGPAFRVEQMLEPVTGTNPTVRPPEHLLLYFM